MDHNQNDTVAENTKQVFNPRYFSVYRYKYIFFTFADVMMLSDGDRDWILL